MQAIILAAGLGSRLGTITATTPKALVKVHSRPLIDYALAFARAAGVVDLTVVGGFCHADVAGRVAARDPKARIVENREFRKGNMITFQAGRSGLTEDRGFLLMNTDHVYNPTIAELVRQTAETATEVTAFCDYDRVLTNDDMKVQLDAAGRVRDMAKTLATWDCGYVGMTFVPVSRCAAHRAAVDAVLAGQGDASHVEAALVELARGSNPPAIADISGHGWLEVDEPAERDHAEAVLAERGWWRDLP